MHSAKLDPNTLLRLQEPPDYGDDNEDDDIEQVKRVHSVRVRVLKMTNV